MHGDFRRKDGKATVKLQSEETGGEEDGYGKGSRRAELASLERWVKPWASPRLGEITASNGVSGAGSAGLQASRKLNSIKPLEDSFLPALCFKTASSSHSVFHRCISKHLLKLLSIIYRWGN